MNFYKIFEEAQNKVLKEKKNINNFLNFIKRDENLLKQFHIYESILNFQNNNPDEIISFIKNIEDYSKKLNYSLLEESNKKMFDFFNLKPTKNSNKIVESIDDLIRYNSGGVYNFLSKGVQYRKEIYDYLIQEKQSTQNRDKKFSFKHINNDLAKKIMLREVNEKYESLNNKEKIIFDILKNKKFNSLKERIELIQKRKNFINEKEKKLVLDSLKVLNEKIQNKTNDFENLTFEIISLQESLIKEGKYGPGTEKKIPNLEVFKNIIVSCSENKNKPEQIIIDFEFFVKIKEEGYKNQIDYIKEFEKRYYSGVKNSIKTILPRFKNFSDWFIFDGSVPTTSLSKDKLIKITGEIYLETINEETENKDFEYFLKPSVDFIINLEKEFIKKFKNDLNEKN